MLASWIKYTRWVQKTNLLTTTLTITFALSHVDPMITLNNGKGGSLRHRTVWTLPGRWRPGWSCPAMQHWWFDFGHGHSWLKEKVRKQSSLWTKCLFQTKEHCLNIFCITCKDFNLMMQCLSGASTDQRMMLVSRPPEATYTELGAQATQFT